MVVIPGIHASDRSTIGLRRYLAWLGHDVRGWELGRNRANVEDLDRLIERLDAEVAEDGMPRTLVGWSLGGLIARAVAHGWEAGCDTLILAVNKGNARAIAAYQKHGFAVRESVRVDIGGGFVMDDFIMARSIA